VAPPRSLYLHDGRILTMDAARPVAEALAAAGGRVVAVGKRAEVEAATGRPGRGDEVIDLRGGCALPAFIDAHVHLLASAAARVSVDCGPERVRSIEELQAALRTRSAALPAGAWLRAVGYDELALRERRHPTRRDLDAAVPDRPARLLHRSGHASVLNSPGLRLAGIGNETPEPPGACIDRELETGEPSGLLLEMERELASRLPPLAEEELASGMAVLSGELLASGVTFVQDASAENGPSEWRLLRRLLEEGRLRQSVSMMEGLTRAGELPESDLEGRLRRGGVKIAPRELEHETAPGPQEMAALVRRVDGMGRQAVVHAVGRQTVAAAAAALAGLGGDAVRARRHRVEHAGVCSPETALLLGELGATVVSQPGFLYWNGDSIQQRVAEADLPWLYPYRLLMKNGVRLAFSSDSPVAPPEALRTLRAALERRARSGAVLNQEERIEAGEALAAFTRDAAWACGVEGERGSLTAGRVADIVVLSSDPSAPEVEWDGLAVIMTLQAGEVSYCLKA
jgi:hypothetical protein